MVVSNTNAADASGVGCEDIVHVAPQYLQCSEEVGDAGASMGGTAAVGEVEVVDNIDRVVGDRET